MTQLNIPDGIFGDQTPDPAQVLAVENAAKHKVSGVTGGPGVGKTFTEKALIRLLKSNGLSVALCAPTGKAAKQITIATGEEASTIHRLLGWTPDGFRYNVNTPIETDANGRTIRGGPLFYDAVILDEASMVSAELFAALVAALRPDARFIIVGDVDQLPSIGAGRVLYDLIESGKVPFTRLTKIFRQAGPSCAVHGVDDCPGAGECDAFDPGSRIPYVARALNTGATPDIDPDSCRGTDVVFAEAATPADVLRSIVAAVRTHLPNKGFSLDDIQVLAPQNNLDCGVENLNYVLQRELNPAAADTRALVNIGRGYKATRGDRVIHTHNNYNLNTMNGEIGKVVAANWRGISAPQYATGLDLIYGGENETAGPNINKKVALVVEYDDRAVAYTADEARDLWLAYAITIHKSQGSQFPAVVMPVHSCHKFMLTRPLVYTGITRAQSQLLMIGEAASVAGAATNLRGVHRRTSLQERV